MAGGQLGLTNIYRRQGTKYPGHEKFGVGLGEERGPAVPSKPIVGVVQVSAQEQAS